MRILVVSHNVFSETENMGKTLVSYFKDFGQENLAQFYIHSEIPTSDICNNYYRVTDKEMIKSVFGFKTGKVLSENDIQKDRKTSRTDSGTEAKLYQKARKRTPLIYILRNLWWKLGRWDNKQFRAWTDKINPDCIFFVSGDYAFMYDIALKTAKSRNIPLYVSCMDDYYFNNKNNGKFLGGFQYKHFMKSVNKAMSYSTAIFCICDSMTEDYEKLFNKKCVTIHTAASFEGKLEGEKKRKISYIGNLGYNRHLQLIDIGRALKKLGTDIDHIDVYSSEKREEILKLMTAENGIAFHGSISADEVKKVMAESLAVIHTESFDENIKNSVRYSVSTKIADSLMSGTCILAYGPGEIASIKYLSENKAAICVTSKIDLENELLKLINEPQIRNKVVENALKLAQSNHSPDISIKLINGAFLKKPPLN